MVRANDPHSGIAANFFCARQFNGLLTLNRCTLKLTWTYVSPEAKPLAGLRFLATIDL
jgi:hypothetical protein